MNYELTGNIKKAISEFENILEKIKIQKDKALMAEKKIQEVIKVISKIQENARKGS